LTIPSFIYMFITLLVIIFQEKNEAIIETTNTCLIAYTQLSLHSMFSIILFN
jgi:hypothetical protein